MNLDVQAMLSDLKAKALPIAEKDLIVVADSILSSVQAQAVAQASDPVAAVVSVVLGALKPAIDAELAKLLPAAAQA